MEMADQVPSSSLEETALVSAGHLLIALAYCILHHPKSLIPQVQCAKSNLKTLVNLSVNHSHSAQDST